MQIISFIKKHRFIIVLAVLINLVLTPLSTTLLNVNGGLMGLINFTLVIGVSLITAKRKIPKVLVVIAGLFTLFFVWHEFFDASNDFVALSRMYSSLALFCLLAYILMRSFLKATTINIKVIFGAMAGYILIGLIGGILFEILEYYYSGSIKFPQNFIGYDYYYYSFISILSVGYGDLVPASPAAKSLTIVLSTIGQFYMAIGIALFVGKHLSQKNNTF